MKQRRIFKMAVAIFIGTALCFGVVLGGEISVGGFRVGTEAVYARTDSGGNNPTLDNSGSSGTSCAGVDTNLISCDEDDGKGSGIFHILTIVLNVLTFGVGAAGVLGLVISGIQYMTAAGNQAQMTKAKNRIVQVVIGLVFYGLFWALLEWLIPGGILNR
ncbi:hypothetical protein IJG20_00585 [Candidatus Saccharibacteria bacterium]|nr:hypothetical protein [Candidatus Saccharibacteria bacterium]